VQVHCKAVVYLLTNATSSMVTDVSAILVDSIIFLIPKQGFKKTFLCSEDGIPECRGKIENDDLLLKGWVLSSSKDSSEISCQPVFLLRVQMNSCLHKNRKTMFIQPLLTR